LNTCSNGSCTSRALLFSGGTFTDLGTLNGANSVAQAVNASGEVVGYIGVIPYTHAALFANGNVTDLGLLPGGTFTFATDINWEEVIREPSPCNPGQKKSQVQIKRRQKGNAVYLLCVSEGREQKDRAIREKQEQQLQDDLEALKTRIEKGHLKSTDKIHEAMGRLKERYPRGARYYRIEYDAERNRFSWQEDINRKAIAEKLDGGYVLKTDRQDLTGDEIWRTYMLLTRVEAAFRAMKSPLMERPIFHHLQDRTQTHIFLCLLAYHLLAAIEKRFLDRDLHTPRGRPCASNSVLTRWSP
jgi:probable HAF family extracellular repeat protein